jgi:hypothetical protein
MSCTASNDSIAANALVPQTSVPFPDGGQSAKSAAMNTGASNTKMASELSNLSGGKKRKSHRKLRGGACDTIDVASAKTIYPETGGPGQTSSDVSMKLFKLQANSAAQSEFDSQAAQRGGTKWGCYSGGRKRRSRISRRGRKLKKTRRTRITRTRKSRKQ